MFRILPCLIVASALASVAFSAEGRTLLVYEITEPKEPTARDVEKTVDALHRRLELGWFSPVKVRAGDNNQIEVAVHDPKLVEPTKRLVENSGELEFRIVADPKKHAEIIAKAKALPAGKSELRENDKLLARWAPVRVSETTTFSRDENLITRTVPGRDGMPERLEVLVVQDEQNVTGNFLTRVRRDIDSNGGPCLQIEMNQVGGKRMGALTSANLPDRETNHAYRLAIIINGEVYSAPRLMSAIYSQAQITGHFTMLEVDQLVAIFNSGVLPCRLKLISER